ncbi:KilA-N domain-containing protein [Sphaerospermopsis sp. LEGE 00249]|uniref:KilA-N domain-containing protein n=1 Tax=Sphaerospermopsis sp. LEGE 00249 TaxID=1380707 RepID=UPI00164E5396|nr:KilA-N domain-containing protein [Sphaerospermopsis sp. LEGE 00249]MBC5794222.1 KilA-N domain-containing protein [Sphaerospermopsis sp. LEGE 00249]
MSDIEKFSELVQDAQREDSYVNATKWAKAFGYRLDNWKELPETKARLKALEENTLKNRDSVTEDANNTVDTECPKIRDSVMEGFNNTANTEYLKNRGTKSHKFIYSTGRGYGAVTWVHPIMAVHLASYLDPAFANYVAEVFVRYITADPYLAADIASRQETTKGLDIINEAVQERYKFLKSRLTRNYYIIRDGWGHKLRYNTKTKGIELDGRVLDLDDLHLEIAVDLNLDIKIQDAKDIVKNLAIVNTYPSMDEEDQKRFYSTYCQGIRFFNFVPTKDCPKINVGDGKN